MPLSLAAGGLTAGALASGDEAGPSSLVVVPVPMPETSSAAADGPSLVLAPFASGTAEREYTKDVMRRMRSWLCSEGNPPAEVQRQMQEVWLDGQPQGPMLAAARVMFSEVETEAAGHEDEPDLQAALGELADGI